MTVTEFFTRCLAAGCVVVAVRTYTQYNEAGKIDERHFIGIGYVALPFRDPQLVISNPFEILEEVIGPNSTVLNTPEAALGLWEARR